MDFRKWYLLCQQADGSMLMQKFSGEWAIFEWSNLSQRWERRIMSKGGAALDEKSLAEATQ